MHCVLKRISDKICINVLYILLIMFKKQCCLFSLKLCFRGTYRADKYPNFLIPIY